MTGITYNFDLVAVDRRWENFGKRRTETANVEQYSMPCTLRPALTVFDIEKLMDAQNYSNIYKNGFAVHNTSGRLGIADIFHQRF